jgi:sugar lactone lactonase YvrE
MTFRIAPLMALVACGGGRPDQPDGPGGADGRTDGPPVIDARPPDARPPDAHPDAGPADCDNLPTTPVPVTFLPGFVASEDLAFDYEGNVIESDTQNIYKTTKTGSRVTFVPGLQFRAGMRLTTTNKLIVNNDNAGSLVRVDPDGSKHTILGGLSYPNGMEIGADGYVYITDQSQERTLRVDPETGANTTLTQCPGPACVNQPNGLTFSRDFQTLYIGAFSGEGTIYAIDVATDGTPSNFRAWKTGVGTGWLDGMGVDACGNVYIADYGQSKILRIKADASGTPTVIVDRSATWSYMPNYQWGSGLGGWDEHKLYIVGVGEGLFEVDVGVDSKPRPEP